MKAIVTGLLCIVLLTAGFFSRAHADEISIRADEWCPYNCVPGTEKPGYMIEIARAVFEPAGHRVDYQLLNWARSIEWAETGKINAIVGAGKDEVPHFIFPDNDMGYVQNAFFVKKENPWRFSGVDSLSEIRLGLIEDYSYGELFEEYIEKHRGTSRVQFVGGKEALEKNIRKCLAGRIDAILEDESVFRYRADALGVSDRFVFAGNDGPKDTEDFVYIAFSPVHPKSREYAELLTDGLREIRTDGRLQKILSRYGISNRR